MTTQKQIRRAFWEQHPEMAGHWTKDRDGKKLYPCDIRCAFVDFVDHLARDRTISEALASRVTL